MRTGLSALPSALSSVMDAAVLQDMLTEEQNTGTVCVFATVADDQ